LGLSWDEDKGELEEVWNRRKVVYNKGVLIGVLRLQVSGLQVLNLQT